MDEQDEIFPDVTGMLSAHFDSSVNLASDSSDIAVFDEFMRLELSIPTVKSEDTQQLLMALDQQHIPRLSCTLDATCAPYCPDNIGSMSLSSLSISAPTSASSASALAAAAVPSVQQYPPLAYINQSQDYFLALKFPEHCVLRSSIVLGFAEPLKYNAQDSIAQWKAENAQQEIVEIQMRACQGMVDVRDVTQDVGSALSCIQFTWEGQKNAILCFKINCLSTSFTESKRGGEKGVKFVLQVDTTCPDRFGYMFSHRVALKVFKGRAVINKRVEKDTELLKRHGKSMFIESQARTEMQPVPFDPETSALMAMAGSRALGGGASSSTSFGHDFKHQHQQQHHQHQQQMQQHQHQHQQMQQQMQQQQQMQMQQQQEQQQHMQHHQQQVLHDSSWAGEGDLCDLPPLRQMSFTLPSLPPHPTSLDGSSSVVLSEDSSEDDVQWWLSENRFWPLLMSFSRFNGADMMQLQREDFVTICGPADGLRMFRLVQRDRARVAEAQHGQIGRAHV